MTGKDEEKGCRWKEQEHRQSEETLLMVEKLLVLWFGCITGCSEDDGRPAWGGRWVHPEALVDQDKVFFVVGNGESLNLEIASNILLLEKCFHRHDYSFNLDHNPPREAGQDSPMRKKVLGSKEPHTGSFKISCFCPL